MPEAPEVDTDKLREAIDEEIEKEGGALLRTIALTTAIFAAVAAIASVSTAGAHQRATMQLHIGAPMALSGTWAVFDEPLLNGIKEAVKEINAKGGVDGVTVKLDYSDFRGDSTQQLADVQKMLDNGIKVFIASNGGSLDSENSSVRP